MKPLRIPIKKKHGLTLWSVFLFSAFLAQMSIVVVDTLLGGVLWVGIYIGIYTIPMILSHLKPFVYQDSEIRQICTISTPYSFEILTCRDYLIGDNEKKSIHWSEIRMIYWNKDKGIITFELKTDERIEVFSYCQNYSQLIQELYQKASVKLVE